MTSLRRAYVKFTEFIRNTINENMRNTLYESLDTISENVEMLDKLAL